jgi:hypothetical protein
MRWGEAPARGPEALTSEACVEQTGRRCDLTWDHAGDREGMRRSQNTMGYQARTLTQRRLDYVSEFGSESSLSELAHDSS